MTDLTKSLENDYLLAVKAKDQKKVDICRLLKSAINNEQIAKKSELLEDDVLKVLKKEAKKRQEAIQVYAKGNREDLKVKEEFELSVIKEYLPEELAEEKIEAIVKKVINDNSFSQQDFGQTMKLSMKELDGQADGKQVSPIVKKLLN